MEVSSKHLTADLIEINTKFTKDQVSSLFSKELTKTAQKVSLKGFRKGKTPLPLVKKMYGQQIMMDLITNELRDNIEEYIKQENITIFGTYVIKPTTENAISFDPENITDTEISYWATIEKDIELDDLNINNELFYPLPTLTQSEVEKQVLNIRKSLGEDIEVQQINDNSKVFGSLNDNDHTYIITFQLDQLKSQDLKSSFLNKKVNDIITIQYTAFAENKLDFITRFITEVESEESNEKKSIELLQDQWENVTITKIQERIPAEIDANFFSQLSQNQNQINDLEHLKTLIQTDFERNYSDDSNLFFFFNLKNLLTNSIQLDISDEYYNAYFTQVLGLSKHHIDHHFEENKEYFKWSMIKDQLDKDYAFIPNQHEIKSEFARQLLSYMGGMNQFPPDFLDQYIDQMMKNKVQVNKVTSTIYTRKVANFFKDEYQVPIRHLDPEEYNQLMSELNDTLRKIESHDHDQHTE